MSGTSITVRSLVVIAAVTVIVVRPSAHSQESPAVTALASYITGQHQAALAQLPASLTVGVFLGDLSAWIRAAQESAQPRRALVATIFAMDAIWSRSKSHDRQTALRNSVWIDTSSATNAERRDWSRTVLTDSYGQFPIAAWACSLSRDLRLDPNVEQAWWMLSIGLMENIRVWRALAGPMPGEVVVAFDSPAARELRDGHLQHVPDRVKSTPEFMLTATLTAIARDVAAFEPSRSGRPDVLRAEPLTERAKAALPAARKALMALAVHPSIRGEVLLRTGYFDLRLGRFDQALQTIAEARPLLQEAFLQAVADYLTGWIHQHQSRHDLAVEFLARARQYAPHMRNVSVLLAQELFLAGRASDAYEILDGGVRAASESLDFLITFERGNARRIPEHLEVLRRGMQ